MITPGPPGSTAGASGDPGNTGLMMTDRNLNGSNANHSADQTNQFARKIVRRGPNPIGDGINRKMRRAAKKKFHKEIEPTPREPIAKRT